MAINLVTQYDTRATAASLDYPSGSFKNISAPGLKDGTPLEQAWANDILGSRDAILLAAGLTADGNVETAQSSQVLDAIYTLIENKISSKKWNSFQIGQAIPLNSVDLPPTNDTSCVWIELSAASTYASNSSNLTSISTTGTAPLILSTAVINNANSPLNGKTISLINDEGRYVISGTTGGTLRNDAMQPITGTLSGVYSQSTTSTGALSYLPPPSNSYNTTASSSGIDKYKTVVLDTTTQTRTDTTTHGRDISARFFMRII